MLVALVLGVVVAGAITGLGNHSPGMAAPHPRLPGAAGCPREDPLVGREVLVVEARPVAGKEAVLVAAAVAADPQAVDPLADLVGPVGAGEVATPVGGLLTSSRSCT